VAFVRNKQLTARITELEAENQELRQVLAGLRHDLTKMLPRSSNTMSALRQREITNFVVLRIDAALNDVERPTKYDPQWAVQPKRGDADLPHGEEF